MAAQKPLFPSTIEAQVSDLHSKKTYLSIDEVKMRLGITDTQSGEMQTSVIAVDSAHAKAENKDTRTHLDVVNRTAAIKSAQGVFRKVINICVVNNSDAIPADYVALSVPQNKRHSTVSSPNSYPVGKVDTNVIRRISIDFRDHDSERRGKPRGVSGAVIRYGILEAQPTSMEELPNLALDTASPYVLNFTEAQRGKRVYFCLAWQNTKGEMGPWSEITSAIVP